MKTQPTRRSGALTALALALLAARAIAGCSGGSVIATDAGDGSRLDATPEAAPLDAPADEGATLDTPPPPDVQPIDVPGRCLRDADCAGSEMGPVCDASRGQCVPCTATNRGSCRPGEYCAANNRCEPGCGSDADCAGDGGRTRCDTARRTCVGCVTDEHCPPAMLCGADNTCAPGCNDRRPCPTGESCCAGRCLPTQADVANCGACGRMCAAANGAPSCAAGACGIASCNAGFGDCDRSVANGCEADLSSAAMNCGTCGTVCAGGTNATPACVRGVCGLTCAPGFADCDGNATNGCEASLSGTANCGRCGNACAGGAPFCAPSGGTFACSSGCAPSQLRCGGSCVDPTTDVSHCGACGNACPAPANATRTCVAGVCGRTCTAGFADCDGDATNGCEASLSGTANCGRCGNPCAGGTPVCAASGGAFACVSGCPAGQLRCAGACVDTATDVSHCGACGNACPAPANATSTCAAGSCGLRCNAGFADCDRAAPNGCEAALATDPRNCGACGVACPSGMCAAGACVLNRTCADVLRAMPGTPSGIYTIDPDGAGGSGPLSVYCDMRTDGGGWTLVAYAPRGSVGALCTDTGVRNLHPLSTGGGTYDGMSRRTAASLPAVPIARLSREILFARSDADFYAGDISGVTAASKFAIPDPSRVNFLNSNPDISGVDRGACTRVTLTTVVGPNVTGQVRYTFANTLSTTWSDTYPTSYGATDIATCIGPGSSLGPSFVSSYSGVGHHRMYCWPFDAMGGAYTYWHLGWWDANGNSRTGAVSIWLR